MDLTSFCLGANCPLYFLHCLIREMFSLTLFYHIYCHAIDNLCCLLHISDLLNGFDFKHKKSERNGINPRNSDF